MMKQDAETLESAYNQVTALYDTADALIASVKAAPADEQEKHFRSINPLVEEIESSADILTEEFIHLAENETDKPCTRSKSAVETTLRKTFAALDAFLSSAKSEPKDALSAAIPLAENAKKQLGRVVGAFLHVVELSLDRVLSRKDLDSLKKEEPKVAELLAKAALENSKTRQ